MNIKFQGQFDKRTLFKAVALANKPSKRSTLIRAGVTTLFIVLYIGYFLTLGGTGTLASSFDALRSDGRHLIAVFLAAYFLFLPSISSYSSASNIWKQPEIHTPVAGTISDAGVVFISSQKKRREIPWESFAKKQSAGNLIVLLTAEGKLSIFPRDFFETDEDWSSFQQWVAAHIRS